MPDLETSRQIELGPGSRTRRLARVAWPMTIGGLFGALLLFFSPIVVLGAAAGLGVLAVLAVRPEIGLLFVVLVTSNLVDPDTLPLIGVGPFSFHTTDIVLLYLLGVLLFKSTVTRSRPLVRTPLDRPLGLFYFAILVAAFSSIERFSVDIHPVLRFVRVLSYYLFFFVTTNLVETREQLRWLIRGLILIAILSSIVMLLGAFFPSLSPVAQAETFDLVTAGREVSGVVRTYLSADRLVYTMLLAALASLALGGRLIPRSLEIIAIGLLSAGLLLTFQRNYLITMFLMIGVLLLLLPRPQLVLIGRWIAAGAAIFILTGLLLGGPVRRYQEALFARVTWGMLPSTLGKDGSVQYRLMETEYAAQSIRRHPILGIGLANSYRPATSHDPEALDSRLTWYIHNAYLWVWTDMGLLGLIPFVWFYGRGVNRGFRRWREVIDPGDRAVVLGFSLAISGQAISNLAAPNFLQSWSLCVFPIALGINEMIYRLQSMEPDS